jgi:hemoglobin
MEGTPSLFSRIGGTEAIFAVVRDFYERIMADPSLRGFFAHLDMNAQIDKQVAFLVFAFGGPSRYTGRDLRTAHAKLVAQGLSDAHFDAVAGHLDASLRVLGVSDLLRAEVLTLVGTTRKDVLGK